MRHTSQVSISSQHKFEHLPAATLCIAANELLKEESLSAEDQNIFTEQRCFENTRRKNRTLCLEVLGKFQTSAIFTNMTQSLTDMSTCVKCLAGMEEKIEYYVHGWKCLKGSKLNGTGREFPTGKLHQMRPVPGRLIMRMGLNRKRRVNETMSMAITLHESSKLAHFREGNMLMIVTRPSRNLFFCDSDSVESRFLKSPFSSDCVEYPFSGSESKSDCVEKCYEQAMGRLGKTPGYISTTNFSRLNFMRSEYDSHKPMTEVDERCSNRCPTDCITKEYFLSALEKYGYESFKNKVRVMIYSTRPSTLIVMVASFDIHSYIIYSASITSLWFGCNLFATVIQLSNPVFKIAEKVRRNWSCGQTSVEGRRTERRENILALMKIAPTKSRLIICLCVRCHCWTTNLAQVNSCQSKSESKHVINTILIKTIHGKDSLVLTNSSKWAEERMVQ